MAGVSVGAGEEGRRRERQKVTLPFLTLLRKLVSNESDPEYILEVEI